MSCSKPNYFLDLGIKENGKRNLKMIPQRVDYNYYILCDRYGKDNILVVPCGKCPSCQKAYKRQWSLRAECESLLYSQSCFVTLTYDNDHVVNEVSKSDLKKFIKDLRNRGIKVRYFGCGEYGHHPVTGDRNRPHYHIILFGYFPNDCKPLTKSKTGFWLFKSKFIEKVWQKGLCTVQEFDSACASYVAGYVDKKIEDEAFLIMSTKPGLGYEYYRRNLDKLADSGEYIAKGGFKSKLPRYFEKVADSAFYDLSLLKDKRLVMSEQLTLAQCQEHGFLNIEELYKWQGGTQKKSHARNL